MGRVSKFLGWIAKWFLESYTLKLLCVHLGQLGKSLVDHMEQNFFNDYQLTRLNLKLHICLIVKQNEQFTEVSFTLTMSILGRLDANNRTPQRNSPISWSVCFRHTRSQTNLFCFSFSLLILHSYFITVLNSSYIWYLRCCTLINRLKDKVFSNAKCHSGLPRTSYQSL